jgi:hypothetical protein
MFKHTIEYTDFNGTERKEDFYFHLSSVEVTRLEAELGKPLAEYVKELDADKDLKTLMDFLEKVILNSYGKKTSDGKSFMKSKTIREEFEYSQAYAELFEQLLTNQDLARKFGENVSNNGSTKKNAVAPQVVNN